MLIGRAWSYLQVGPAGAGSIAVGVRALSESGAVGDFAREQIELFCVSELVNFYLDTDEEFLYLDCSFGSGEGRLPQQGDAHCRELLTFLASCVMSSGGPAHCVY